MKVKNMIQITLYILKRMMLSGAIITITNLYQSISMKDIGAAMSHMKTI